MKKLQSRFKLLYLLLAFMLSLANTGLSQDACNCLPEDFNPVCIAVDGYIVTFPGLCWAECDGFTTNDVVPCDDGGSACNCDPFEDNMVCVQLPDGTIQPFPSPCWAECEGFINIVPCDNGPASCNCDPAILEPVCILTHDSIIIEYPSICFAGCDGYSPNEQVACNNPEPCNCDPAFYDPVCILNSAGATLDYPGLCWAECDGFTANDITPCYGPTPCNCDPHIYDPVCISFDGYLLDFPNLCFAECEGFTLNDIVACDNPTPCGCDPYEDAPVCVEAPDGSIIPYQSPCWAQCDGFSNVMPCSDEPSYCNCDPTVFMPVCILTADSSILQYPDFCYAECDGFTTNDIVPCDNDSEPCGCNPIVFNPVCILTANNTIVEYPDFCYAFCDGYSETDIVPCETMPESCDCDLSTYAPVCVLVDGVPIGYDNFCLAECDGYTTFDLIDCQANCNCDPFENDPVCFLVQGTTVSYPSLCWALCDSLTFDNFVPCNNDPGPCGCDLALYDPVCVLTPDNAIIEYHNNCLAECDGYYNLFPCDNEVYPGDVNADGEVNQLDFLLLTTEHGETGPARNVQSSNWAGWDYTAWGENFYPTQMANPIAPLDLDIALADSNGDGIVEEQDIDIVNANYGLTRSVVNTFQYPVGTEETDPLFNLDYNVTNLGADTRIELVVSSTGIVQNLQGMVFSIEFDPNSILLAEASDISFNATGSWANSDGVAVEFFKVNQAEKRLDIGLSRYSSLGAATGQGVIGKVDIIIGDVIIFLQNGGGGLDEEIKIKNTYLLNRSKANIPVKNGTNVLLVPPPPVPLQSPTKSPDKQFELQANFQMLVYPNPTDGPVSFDFSNMEVFRTTVSDQYGNLIAILNGPVSNYNLYGKHAGFYHFNFYDVMGRQLATRSVFLE